jgi:hypothetical protein
VFDTKGKPLSTLPMSHHVRLVVGPIVVDNSSKTRDHMLPDTQDTVALVDKWCKWWWR